MCVHAGSVADPDIWWHMRVGEWILQHHAVPHVEIFSRGLAGTHWLAYSWLFELLALKLFQWFGVVGIVGYSAGMVLAIAVALRHLIHRLQADFTLTALLTFVAVWSLNHLYTPRPWMLTILFFVLELDILMHARRTGRLRELAWLPLIFMLWANVHIEYIYGLFLLGVAFAESAAARWRMGADTRVPLVAMGGTLLACVLATLVNPFGWGIYGVVYNLMTQGGGLTQVSEMQAIPFRNITDYCFLFFALAATGALAWRRRFPIFESGLLLFATVMAFRSQRDAWLIAIAAATILGSLVTVRRSATAQVPRFAAACAAILAACIVLACFPLMGVSKTVLNSQISNVLPKRAVDAIRANDYPGPIFNDFNWGGYLIWALRQPVAIDGRTNLYGNAGMNRSIATWNAQPNWSTDPQLMSAGTVIGPVTSPLIQVLRTDPRFKLVYEDKLAAVFIAQRGH